MRLVSRVHPLAVPSITSDSPRDDTPSDITNVLDCWYSRREPAQRSAHCQCHHRRAHHRHGREVVCCSLVTYRCRTHAVDSHVPLLRGVIGSRAAAASLHAAPGSRATVGSRPAVSPRTDIGSRAAAGSWLCVASRSVSVYVLCSLRVEREEVKEKGEKREREEKRERCSTRRDSQCTNHEVLVSTAMSMSVFWHTRSLTNSQVSGQQGKASVIANFARADCLASNGGGCIAR